LNKELNNILEKLKFSSLFIIAGPCVVESMELLEETAEELIRVCGMHDLPLIFKSSYKKANRTSISSFSGIGDLKALKYLAEIGEKYNIPVLTDFHSVEEAGLAADYVDILQVPAFLSRQTDILIAAAKTGKPVNIKKGQFMSPDDMEKACDKVKSVSNSDVWLTERGTFFGYHDLVVDFRSIVEMKKFGCPVIFDATHSVQQPSLGEQSGGRPEFINSLARAAIAVGIDGLFFETHPFPMKAKSDAATQLELGMVEKFIGDIIKINNATK